MNEVSLERIYGVLKTYDLEHISQKEIYGMGRMVSTSTSLVVEVPQKLEEKIVQSFGLNKDAIIAEYGVTSTSQSDGDLYSLEELEQLEDESMAIVMKKFGNIRFRRNPDFKLKFNYNRIQGSGSSTSNSQRGGYKTGMVDRGQIRCSNCNEMGHFATECKMQGQMKKDTRKAYLAVEKSWDDTDSDEEEVENLALMAISDNASSSKPQGIKQVNQIVWISDSGCSRHMTGDRALLSNMVEKVGPVVTFGDNNKGLTQGYGSLLVKNVINENSLISKHNYINLMLYL